MTQCERILRHLKDHGSITQAQAMAEYGCLRLAARISDLKRQGHRITASTGHGKNRYGEPTCFAVYRLQNPSTPSLRTSPQTGVAISGNAQEVRADG